MVFVSPHVVWYSSTVILTSGMSLGRYAVSHQMSFSNFFPWVWCSPQLGPWTASGAPDWVNVPVNYELWESFGYNNLSSIIRGLAPSMSTALGLKVKIISYTTEDCRTLLSTFLSPGCQSKLSIRVLRWVLKQVRRAAPPPTPWVFTSGLMPKGCGPWAARASLCWRTSLRKMN